MGHDGVSVLCINYRHKLPFTTQAHHIPRDRIVQPAPYLARKPLRRVLERPVAYAVDDATIRKVALAAPAELRRRVRPERSPSQRLCIAPVVVGDKGLEPRLLGKAAHSQQVLANRSLPSWALRAIAANP